jgi:hypothetical protein
LLVISEFLKFSHSTLFYGLPSFWIDPLQETINVSKNKEIPL